MPLEIRAECDICCHTIHENSYFTMSIDDASHPTIQPHDSIICPSCMNMIRSYIRHGCQKFKEST